MSILQTLNHGIEKAAVFGNIRNAGKNPDEPTGNVSKGKQRVRRFCIGLFLCESFNLFNFIEQHFDFPFPYLLTVEYDISPNMSTPLSDFFLFFCYKILDGERPYVVVYPTRFQKKVCDIFYVNSGGVPNFSLPKFK